MNCSTLQEQAAGSLPSASQVSLHFARKTSGSRWWKRARLCLEARSGLRYGPQFSCNLRVATRAQRCLARRAIFAYMSLRRSLERYALRWIESCAQPASASAVLATEVGNQGSRKNSNSHIDASHSRQPLVKGERLVRYEVNAVMLLLGFAPR